MDIKKYKQQLLDQLYAPYKKCLQCPLGSLGRKNVVFGEGNPDADLVFIGEGPGKNEDEQGQPFVGRAGKLLNHIFELVEIKRENVFITNIVKCRPPGNRKPLPQESKTCKELLLINQLKIIRPRIICTLGSSATQGLLEKNVKITKERGIPVLIDDVTILPTYHPAYILRNPKELETLVKDIQLAVKLSQKK